MPSLRNSSTLGNRRCITQLVKSCPSQRSAAHQIWLDLILPSGPQQHTGFNMVSNVRHAMPNLCCSWPGNSS